MSLISRSIPGLFGGVSQAIPAMRHPTHCELQENGIATLVDGLSKREAFEHIASLAPTGPNGASISGTNGIVHPHVIDRGASGRYSLLIKNGNLSVHDLTTGAVKTVTFPFGKAYLTCTNAATDFHAVTVADHTFILNRTIPVLMTASVSGSRPANRGMVWVKQAVADIAYRITVDGVTATFTSDSTPSVAEITTGLIAALNTALPVGYAVTMVTPPGATEGPVISIVRSSGAATTVASSDGFGNLAMVTFHETVSAYSDLPANLGSTANFVVKVSPNPSASKGAYWVRWDTTTLDYRECSSPLLEDTLDPTTLPHKLVLETNGAFTFTKVTDWTKRTAGDEDSNPKPSFVGKTINDIFFFRNRLGLLSEDGCALSKAGKYYTYFAESAQSVLDTDPIDLSNPTADVVALQWAVPFNEQLLLWADKQQFILVGGDILSPKTARMVPSTAFEAYMGARPESLGNKCVFASTNGDYTALRMLKVASDTVTNQADDLTDHVPRYIPKDIVRVKGSTTAKMLAVVPSSSSLYLFKYEQDDGKEVMTQKSWAVQLIPDTATQTSRIINVHWVDRRLYVIRFIKDTLDTAEPLGRFVIERLDFQSDRMDAGVSFSLRLDRKVQPTGAVYGGTNTTVTIPYWERADMTMLRCVASRAPAVLAVLGTVFNADGTMTLTLKGDQTAATLWAGRKYMFRYQFTEVFMRDQNEAPMQNVKLALKDILVRFVRTGFFRVRVTPYLREEYVYDFTGNVLGTIPVEGNQLATGDFKIPVQSDPSGTTVVMESDSFFPVTFPYAEWRGNVTQKASR